MIRFRFFMVAGLLALALAVSGCVKQKKPSFVYLDVDMVMAPAGTSDLAPGEINRVLSEIEKRNREVEDDPQWIGRAYEGLLVRKLTNVSEKEFPRFREYLDGGSAYIIVHPAFFPFFHYPRKLRSNEPGEVSEFNIVELLLKKKPDDEVFALLQAQERRMRDFIEFKSTQKKLIIVVIPRTYREYSGYTYRKGMDEYMRYLNEVTNFSESVLFVESRSPNRGYLSDDDALRLMEFLLSVNAKAVYVGGGYVGRCLEDFYALLTKEFGAEGIYVVPELSDISPREISGPLALELLKPDGKIDEEVARRHMIEDTYKVQEIQPKIMSLPK